MRAVQRNPLATVFWLLVALAVADLLLLISGYRILVDEQRGSDYTEYSKYTEMTYLGETLSCSYFTGRSVQTIELGAYQTKPDECPFVYKRQH